jgi:hypothetical protein
MVRQLTNALALRAGTPLCLVSVTTIAMAVLIPRGASTATAQIGAHALHSGLDRTMGRHGDVESKSPSDKWFISVISMQNCGACERLKYDFAHAQKLAAFVNVHDKRQSWSHFNVYQREDAAQMERWKNIHIAAFPTIVIQPPRSGEFGDPRTVVWQRSGYDGNEGRLTQDIRLAITRYVAQLPQGESGRPLLANIPQPAGIDDRQAARH